MFDVISYACDNDVLVEVFKAYRIDGFVVRVSDPKSAARESAVIRWSELDGKDDKAAYIETRCDAILAAIGKRKAEHTQREAEQAHRNAIEDFFRSPGNGIMGQ